MQAIPAVATGDAGRFATGRPLTHPIYPTPPSLTENTLEIARLWNICLVSPRIPGNAQTSRTTLPIIQSIPAAPKVLVLTIAPYR